MLYLLKVFFPYLVLFYAVDCFILVQKFHVVLSSRFDGKFRLKRNGIRWIGFSPLCRLFTVVNFPFFIDSKGIYLWNRDNFQETNLYEEQHFSFFLFDELTEVESNGDILKINRTKEIRLHSSKLASYLEEIIGKYKEYSPGARAGQYRRLFQRIEDKKNISGRVFFILDCIGVSVFVHLFIFLPLCLYADVPFRPDLFIFSLLVLWLSSAGLSGCLHRTMYGETKQSIALFFSLIFSPVSSAHAAHTIQNIYSIALTG